MCEELEPEYLKVIKWRTGLRKSIELINICLHHEAKYGKWFSAKKLCIDPWHIHKKRVQGDRQVSLHMAEGLELNQAMSSECIKPN